MRLAGISEWAPIQRPGTTPGRRRGARTSCGTGCSQSLRRTALCLSPGVAWNVFAMLHGAHVQGFDFFSFPSPHRICVAAESAFASVLHLRNGLLPVCLSALVAVMSVTHGERLLARKGLAACFVALLAGVALLGFNESAHYAWIVDNVMPRFVWLCALPLLVSDGHWFSGGTSPYLVYSRPH